MKKLLLALLAIAGCHKAADEHAETTDALWSLAPEGAKIGVVATPRAVGMLEHGLQDVHAFMAKAPDLAPLGQMLDAQIRELTGADNFQLADMGLTAGKGAAYFGVGPDDGVVIVPLADRDKFLAKVHGTKGSDGDTVDHGVCKTVKGYYACASDAAMLATLGKATLLGKLETRGDIELVAADVPGMPMKSVALAAKLERGAFIVHGTVVGLPAIITSKLGGALKPQLDRDHTAGFGVFNVGGLLAAVPDTPIGAGVTTATLASSLVGPVYITVPAGTLTVDIKMPLKDPAPAQALIDKCADLLPPQLSATSQGGTCSIPGSALGVGELGIDAWIDGTTLRIGTKKSPAPTTVSLGKVGSELADGSWLFAFWGRGSALMAPSVPIPPMLLQEPTVAAVLHGMLLLNEMGFAARVDGDKVTAVVSVRTAFSNPDDVVAKLAAASPAEILGGKGHDLAASIATGGSPLAEDVKAGVMGLMPPLAFNLFAASFLSRLGPGGDDDLAPTQP